MTSRRMSLNERVASLDKEMRTIIEIYVERDDVPALLEIQTVLQVLADKASRKAWRSIHAHAEAKALAKARRVDA